MLAVKSSAVVSYNLASALARLGRLIESAELLRVVVRDPEVDATTRDPAQQLLAEIEARIGSITVRVQGDATGATLRLDDRDLGPELVQTISVDPGEHVVAALRRGKTLASQHVRIGGEDPLKAEVMLDLREQLVALPLPDLRVSKLPEENARRANDSEAIWGSPWLWAGAGAVVVAGAVIIVAVALSGDAGMVDPIGGDTDPPLVHGRVQSLLEVAR